MSTVHRIKDEEISGICRDRYIITVMWLELSGKMLGWKVRTLQIPHQPPSCTEAKCKYRSVLILTCDVSTINESNGDGHVSWKNCPKKKKSLENLTTYCFLYNYTPAL